MEARLCSSQLAHYEGAQSLLWYLCTAYPPWRPWRCHHLDLNAKDNGTPQVCADTLGTRAIPLHSLLGRVDARRLYRDRGVAAALSLVTDVHHLNGGRQVTLRSVFRLQVSSTTVLAVSFLLFLLVILRGKKILPLARGSFTSVFTLAPTRRNMRQPCGSTLHPRSPYQAVCALKYHQCFLG